MSTKIIAAGTSVLALTAAFAAPAFAGPTYTADNGGSVTWYGQFNPTLQYYDDGDDSNTEIVDNDNSGSRVGVLIKHPMGGNTLSFRFETSLGLRNTYDVDQNGHADVMDWSRENLRYVDFMYETATAGTFYIGQGAMASDGTGDIDVSGTGVVAGAAVSDAAGGFFFRQNNGALSSVRISDAFMTFDGPRRGRIRYDTPSFNGFTFGVSYGENILTEGDNHATTYDVAVKYENGFGDFDVNGGLAVIWTDQDNGSSDRQDTVASFGAVHNPTGLSASVAYGTRDLDDAGSNEGEYGYVKLGYTTNSLMAAGATSFSIDYYDGSDMASDGDSAESFGVAAVQKFDKYNLEAYLAYREYSYDDTSGTSYQDGSAILAGARWKF